MLITYTKEEIISAAESSIEYYESRFTIYEHDGFRGVSYGSNTLANEETRLRICKQVLFAANKTIKREMILDYDELVSLRLI